MFLDLTPYGPNLATPGLYWLEARSEARSMKHEHARAQYVDRAVNAAQRYRERIK
jgi:hypothetical protein